MKMAKWKDIKENTEAFFDCDYCEVKNMLGVPFAVVEVKAFENDKGPGIAAKGIADNEEYYICTHSIGICNVLGSDEFLAALAKEPLEIIIRRGKSKKTGKEFYYVE